MVDVEVLGSGSPLSGAARNHAGFLVHDGIAPLVVDMGTGTFKALLSKMDLRLINNILLTHFHPDHCEDIVPFLYYRKKAIPEKLGNSEPRPQINVFGPAGLKEFYTGLTKIFPVFLKMPVKVNLTEMHYSEEKVFGYQIFSMPVHHEHAVGYRITREDKVVVFSGDTGYCEEIISLAKDCDLLVLECSYPNNQVTERHLTPAEAGEIARRANAKALLLTHFYPEVEKTNILQQIEVEYHGKIFIGEDGLKVKV
jgi:ribonuclease BN (tRNA processing enzyme)